MSTLFYHRLADLLVLLHLTFVLFVLFGGLLILKWPWVMWLHLPAASWGALIEFTGWICPLTPLEQWLRETGGGLGYQSGFIEHYVLPLLYPAGLTGRVQVVLGLLVLLLNCGVYLLVFRRRRQSIQRP
ncbi:MAG: DUF2784 domain-containing protein [Nitrospira sp.]|nr:DUF2784 domain-containing protein [Nitrospira sp.]